MMTNDAFVKLRAPIWRELEILEEKAIKNGVDNLDDAEILDLIRLYPAITVDVSRAKLLNVDRKNRERLNNLAITAHSLIYRKKRKRYLRGIFDFFAFEYPALFRRHSFYFILAFTLFLIPLLGTYACVVIKPSNAYLFVPGDVDFVDKKMGVSKQDISERFRQVKSPPLAAGVMTNNMMVAFNAFALGIFAGLGTAVIILFNAMMLGGFAAHFANHGLLYEFCAFIAPHGVLEIFAILVAAAAGLRMGLALAIPGKLTRAASLRVGAGDAVLLVLGTIPMFVVAGLLEGFVTPSQLANLHRVAIGVSIWALVMAYLLTAGSKSRGS